MRVDLQVRVDSASVLDSAGREKISIRCECLYEVGSSISRVTVFTSFSRLN